MARESREEKTIKHAEIVVKDLAKLYNSEGIAYVEYKNLFNEYSRVTKRFNKTISMNDSVGKNVIKDNEQLKENVTYTIKKAKDKILYNIAEHKKTKEVLMHHAESYTEVINRLKRELRDLRQYTHKLEQELNKSDEIQHQFHETFDEDIKSKEINAIEIKSKSLQTIITEQLQISKQSNAPLTLVKLSVDEFSQKLGLLEGLNSDKKGLLKVLYKFFSISLGAKNIVYYWNDNVFYILLPNTALQNSKGMISKINIPRKLSNVTFTFSLGVTEFIPESDNFKTLDDRLQMLNEKASEEKNLNSVIFQ
ncbi:MAG: hypothetical protein WBG69_01345 [Arcobacteraceae bacterium]